MMEINYVLVILFSTAKGDYEERHDFMFWGVCDSWKDALTEVLNDMECKGIISGVSVDIYEADEIAEGDPKEQARQEAIKNPKPKKKKKLKKRKVKKV